MRREAFIRKLREAAKREGFDISHSYWLDGVLIRHRRHLHTAFDVIYVTMSNMTDNKIRELLVRWRMGL